MNNKATLSAWIREKWQNLHWLILAFVVFVSALFELLEFYSGPYFLKDPTHIIELIFQGIILPVVFITLHRTETQKNDAIKTLSLHDAFNYQLYKTQNWDELIKVIAQLPRNIIPLSGVGLLLYSPNSKRFDLELANVFDPVVQMAYLRNPIHLEDAECCQTEPNKNSSVRVCSCSFQLQDRKNSVLQKRYCLPLRNANSFVGLLHFHPSRSYELMEDQKSFLNSTVPQIVNSINEAMLERRAILQQATYETARLRLASDLHDTLGQNLAYLRNKIDELDLNRSFKRNHSAKKGLHQMSIVVEEANQIVRNMLAATHSKQETELDVRLLSYAKTISERANFTIIIESHGQSQILNTHMQFQIFLMFREILANIEMHAAARRVMVMLIWSDDELTLEISDDGRGFLVDCLDKNEHFGLTIIEMRTQELNGDMSVVSAPNEGTKVSIRLPINFNDSLLSKDSIIYEENAIS